MQPSGPLTRPFTMQDYITASSPSDSSEGKDYTVSGVIYVETDRRLHGGFPARGNLGLRDWAAEPLKELSFLRRVVEGMPEEGEEARASEDQAALLRGIVAWAPIEQGAVALRTWLVEAESTAGRKTWERVKGFRYLLQGMTDEGKFRDVVLGDDFMGCLEYLALGGYAFAVFPPHSTHRLQLLDVSVFSPLATAYSKALNMHIYRSVGFSRVTKRVFWPLFEKFWNNAVSPANVLSGWTKIGLEPFDLSVVLSSLRIQPAPENNDIDALKRPEPPRNGTEYRRLLKTVHEDQETSNRNTDMLVSIVKHLSFENKLLYFQNKAPQEAFLDDRKRRKRGKAVGLITPSKPKFGQIFSPERIERVQEAHHQKQQDEERLKAQKADARLQRQIHAQENIEARLARQEQVR
jgi:hypothetical protein